MTSTQAATAVRPVAAPQSVRLHLLAAASGRRPSCPRCETPTLMETLRHGVAIDRCRRCGGIWLDAGELEALLSAAGPGRAR